MAVVGIGDDLSPTDRLGMDAARFLDGQHLPGVKVFLAGTVPENITGPLRRYHPNCTLFLDAADSGARPGSVVLITPERVGANLVTTHVLPLTVVIEYVEKETGSPSTLLGIQPDLSRPDKNLDEEDLAFLRRNLGDLAEILRNRQ